MVAFGHAYISAQRSEQIRACVSGDTKANVIRNHLAQSFLADWLMGHLSSCTTVARRPLNFVGLALSIASAKSHELVQAVPLTRS